MKPLGFSILIAVVQILNGCERSNLFESKPAEDETPAFEASGDVVIAMVANDGVSGDFEKLVIDANGHTQYVNRQKLDGQIIAYSSPDEYGALVSLFLKNGFLHLANQYTGAERAGDLLYNITFHHAGNENTVTADYTSAPASLQEIIDRLSRFGSELVEQSPTLTLQMSTTELRPGQTVDLTLEASNTTAQAITLTFGGQEFDLFAIPLHALSSDLEFAPELPPYAWNWAHDRVFIQIIRQKILNPGESLRYSVSWNGLDNGGQQLAGDYLIGARLASLPGGFTSLKVLRIVGP